MHFCESTFWYFDLHATQAGLFIRALQRRHNGRDSISNHQPYDCLLIRLFRRRSRKTSKLLAPGLCARNSPVKCFHLMTSSWVQVIISPHYFRNAAVHCLNQWWLRWGPNFKKLYQAYIMVDAVPSSGVAGIRSGSILGVLIKNVVGMWPRPQAMPYNVVSVTRDTLDVIGKFVRKRWRYLHNVLTKSIEILYEAFNVNLR